MKNSRVPNTAEVLKGVLTRLFEQKKLDTVLADGVSAELRDYRVEYFKQGDFTVAAMSTKQESDEDRVTFVGVSKRNPEDRPNPLRGKALALSRAAREAAEYEIERLTTSTGETVVVTATESLFSRNIKKTFA